MENREKLLQTVLSDYILLVLRIQVQQDHYEELVSFETLEMSVGKEGSVSGDLCRMMHAVVLPEDQAGVLALLDLQASLSVLEPENEVEYVFRNREGSWRRMRIHAVEYENGKVTEAVLTIGMLHRENQLEQAYRKRLQNVLEENHKLKYIDALTGCLNKMGFSYQATELLGRHPNRKYALCYSDIINLGYINSSLGYDAGNELLQYWSCALRSRLRDEELLGRVSGDYFAALFVLDENRGQAEIETICHEVSDEVDRYFKHYDRHFQVKIYSGVYIVTPEEIGQISVYQMMNRAAIAQKSAKGGDGNSVAFFNAEQWNRRRRAIEISRNLTNAIAAGEIDAWLQPQYDYATHRIVGAEALCRWNSQTMGWLSPGEFIPALEDSGQIGELDSYIWEKVFQHAQALIQMSDCVPVPLSINLSRKDMQCFDVVEKILSLQEKYQVPPEWIRVEITESVYMEEPKSLIDTVTQLQEHNFIVEMDDFGSGYSSLSMLNELPVDVMKMDLRFLSVKHRDRKGGNILSSVIRMAHGMNLAVIAEGVEMEEQAEALKNMGCNVMQGYLFGKAMPFSEFCQLPTLRMMGKESATVAQENDQKLECLYDILSANSRSSYIFNHFSNATAILEYTGGNVEIMSINDEFLRVVGDLEARSRANMKNGLFLVRETDRPKVLSALQKAVEVGRAECEVFFDVTKQWVRLTCRHVFSTPSSNYLFCESVNTTKEHSLTAQVNNLVEEAKTEFDMMPVGTLRYEAEGGQKFAYISNALLSLLKYPSLEAFYHKFPTFPDMIYEEDRERVLREINDQITKNGSKDYCEYRIETGEGQLKWVYDHGRLVTDAQGKKWFYVVIADLDQMIEERLKLQGAKYQVQALVPGVNSFEYEIASDTMTVSIAREGNEKQTLVLCHYEAQMEQRGWGTVETATRVREAFRQAAKTPMSGSIRYDGCFGSEGVQHYRCYYTSMLDKDGRVCRIVGNIANVGHDAEERHQRAWQNEINALQG